MKNICCGRKKAEDAQSKKKQSATCQCMVCNGFDGFYSKYFLDQALVWRYYSTLKTFASAVDRDGRKAQQIIIIIGLRLCPAATQGSDAPITHRCPHARPHLPLAAASHPVRLFRARVGLRFRKTCPLIRRLLHGGHRFLDPWTQAAAILVLLLYIHLYLYSGTPFNGTPLSYGHLLILGQ